MPYKGGGPVMIDLLGGQGVQCLLLASRCSAHGLAFRRQGEIACGHCERVERPASETKIAEVGF